MKRPFLFFGLLFQTLFAFSQIGLPIKQSLLPKNSLVVDYDFTKSSSYTRGATTVTNIASTASGNATLFNTPNFFNSIGILSFNGSTQYLATPNLRTYFKSVNASVQESFTMSMWVYPTQLNGVIVTELNSQTPNSGWHASNIEIVNGFINYRIWSGTTIVSMSAVNLNQWCHIAMVYDGSKLKAYLNGVLQGTQVNDREIPTTAQHYAIAATESTQMGSGGGYGTFHLAQYKIYHLPFTDSAIAQEYDTRKAEFDYTIHSPSTNSNPTYWTISSAWNNSTGGTGTSDAFSAPHFTPWLNSSLGWAAQALDANQYIILNYHEPAYIKGIVTQPRASSGNQWIKTAHIETSMNGSSFTRLLTSVAVNSSIVDDNYIKFTNPVFAKYVKLIPTDWNNHITMRMGLLVKPNNYITDGQVLRLDAANSNSYAGTGTVFKDLTTNLSDFTLVVAPTYDANGFFTFNGTSQYASRVHTSSLKPSTAITLEQWLYADSWTAGTSSSNYKCALSCTNGGGYSHNIWNGSFYSYIYAGGRYLVPSASVSNLYGWHHFVTTFDGQFAKLYIDGSLANTVDYGSANTTMTYSANSIFLGAEAGASTAPEGYYWQGKIANTAIYSKALNNTEILQNYNYTKMRFNIIQDGLVSNLINPPSSGTTWTDASGNGNNATLNGTPTYTSSNGGGYTTSSTSYISTGYNLPSAFTVSIAASFNPTTYWATMWGNESWTAGKGYLAYLGSSTGMNFGSPSGTAAITVSGLNTIHIWDFVVNGTSYTLYKDGVSFSTGTITAPSGGLSTTGLYFGARHGNAGTTFADACPGTYYSMRVYNRALSATEIGTNFTVLRANYGL